ncbi:MAG: metallophosphoesterase [Sedimentisphaerales bacterium]|nr:metallophosphoesterase [Sedimentisphaerales bacterium]
MRKLKIFLGLLVLVGLSVLINSCLIEPTWIKIEHLRLNAPSSVRLVHISDIHHEGDRKYLAGIISKINTLQPEFVCFTGDLVEDSTYLSETLSYLRQIKVPVYGVPGNHDFWSHSSFVEIETALRSTGGDWLTDEEITIADGKVTLLGLSGQNQKIPPVIGGGKRILLCHYPDCVDQVQGRRFDLVLAGHSHGGQVRLPFIGALHVPYRTGSYDKGLFHTPAGPLYVNPGLGTFGPRVRFFCRPEITVIEL